MNSDTPLITNKLLKTMRATNAQNCRYAVIWYVLSTRPFVLNLLRLRFVPHPSTSRLRSGASICENKRGKGEYPRARLFQKADCCGPRECMAAHLVSTEFDASPEVYFGSSCCDRRYCSCKAGPKHAGNYDSPFFFRRFVFHCYTTHAAASLAGRKVRILKQ